MNFVEIFSKENTRKSMEERFIKSLVLNTYDENFLSTIKK